MRSLLDNIILIADGKQVNIEQPVEVKTEELYVKMVDGTKAAYGESVVYRILVLDDLPAVFNGYIARGDNVISKGVYHSESIGGGVYKIKHVKPN